jgi:hypothetical protein
MNAHYNRVGYVAGPLSLCSIYGHDWETLALGEIVCRECGAVHRQHEWRDMSTGKGDDIHEIVKCVICGQDKEEWDRVHASTVLLDELP